MSPPLKKVYQIQSNISKNAISNEIVYILFFLLLLMNRPSFSLTVQNEYINFFLLCVYAERRNKKNYYYNFGGVALKTIYIIWHINSFFFLAFGSLLLLRKLIPKKNQLFWVFLKLISVLFELLFLPFRGHCKQQSTTIVNLHYLFFFPLQASIKDDMFLWLCVGKKSASQKA